MAGSGEEVAPAQPATARGGRLRPAHPILPQGIKKTPRECLRGFSLLVRSGLRAVRPDRTSQLKRSSLHKVTDTGLNVVHLERAVAGRDTATANNEVARVLDGDQRGAVTLKEQFEERRTRPANRHDPPVGVKVASAKLGGGNPRQLNVVDVARDRVGLNVVRTVRVGALDGRDR